MKTLPRVLIFPTLLVALGLGLFFAFDGSRRDPDRPAFAESASTTRAEDTVAQMAPTREGMAPLAPGDDEPPPSALATLRASGSSFELASLDGEFERVVAEAGEVFEISLRATRFASGRAVRIDADHGGSLDRRSGPIESLVAGPGGEIAFTYAVGGHRGRYTVEVSQGQTRELFEFWVGPQPPQGDAGTARAFSAPETRG